MKMTWQEMLASRGISIPQKQENTTNKKIVINQELSQKEKTFSLDIELDEDQSTRSEEHTSELQSQR